MILGNLSEDCNLSSSSSLCSSQRSSSAASAAREEFFQPKDLVWLDPCDEHRDEEIEQAVAGIPNLNRPQVDLRSPYGPRGLAAAAANR
ncbi:hypothetical protein CN231_13225 [Sinorhizobium meliloti]|nr:hypothetical protein EBB04_11675 [Sinorhizobium meliloti]RVE88366.1 hypothetical protein CN238_16120 [Sinorhizobium meliloti]RVG17518.1 hypothetical protein CN231_13225 [Sinorhizobium meliloti]RVH28894.1 hypothetical protein CN214_17150 [Sinorhizobium meliloti]RVH31611.1 hypothetical protein CN211_21230 [Sinorhizobium meliloti]